MTAVILRGDARHLPLADGSVDLIVTSPPYYALRSYTDSGEHYDGQIGAEDTPAAYVDALVDCTREWIRVLKPTGSIWLNLGDSYSRAPAGPQGSTGQRATRRSANEPNRAAMARRSDVRSKSLRGLPWRYALRCIDDLGLILRAEVIWSKPNGLPESVTDRVRRSHEQWFHLVRQPRYYSAVDRIRQPHVRSVRPNERLQLPGGGMNGQRQIPGRSDYLQPGSKPAAFNPLGALPGSVWTVPTQPLTVPPHLGVDHFAAFPMEWPRRLILGWSPPAGTVLDPFGGTGTTALMAHALGRIGISVDMSADYCRLARWRTTDPGQLAAALQVDRPPVQVVDQMDLLGLLP